jgi:putative transposase
MTIASLIESLKSSSSKWMKKQGVGCEEFSWQRGYGAFSVSESNVPRVREYIAKQDEHHRKISFQEEFQILCRKHGLKIDERYAWD